MAYEPDMSFSGRGLGLGNFILAYCARRMLAD
jgi:hypothetical protein